MKSKDFITLQNMRFRTFTKLILTVSKQAVPNCAVKYLALKYIHRTHGTLKAPYRH